MTAESRVAVEIRRQLRRLTRERGEDFQLTLTRYGLERLLYRLGTSEHAESFVLKGAMLFHVLGDALYRPTRDLDLLGRGDPSVERVEEAFRAICNEDVEEDGLRFEAETVLGAVIKEGQRYEGVRVRFVAWLGETRIPIQVDVGFGDAITPDARTVTFPTLLDLPPPVLRAYPAETVVAEKYQALVDLGSFNSRMKDFYDLWRLARTMSFDGETLSAAIGATFVRRGTALPEVVPIGLTAEWANEERVRSFWRGFLERSGLAERAADLHVVVAALRGFLLPPTAALRAGDPFAARWPAGGPWSADRP
jgi:predicted nucleotidyltransferase component of viral defense system